MAVFKKAQGETDPLIAVPVMPETGGQAAKMAAEAAAAGADLVELRADAAWRGSGSGVIPSLLQAAADGAGGVPVLFTLRTVSEGGLAEADEASYREALLRAASSGLASCVDVELERDPAGTLAGEIRRRGSEVLLSKHDFHATPSFDGILAILGKMERLGADVAKCAFMPVRDDDVSFAEAASAEAFRCLGIPHLVISMGERGLPSRLSCGVYGSAMTFGCLPGAASAPGQIEAGELRARIGRIRAIRKRGSFLFLTGFMGTGKTTVAAALSKLTGLPSVEMDAEIVGDCGKPIPRIFAESGEEGFRELETKLLAGLYDREPAIVSCGGGAVLRKENAALMKALGRVVLLTAEPETILRRLTGESSGRPMISGRMSVFGVRDLLEKRGQNYAAAADCTVRTDGKTPEEIARGIAAEVL